MSTKENHKRKELADLEEGDKRYYVVTIRPEDEDRIVKKAVEALRTEMETLAGTLVEGTMTTLMKEMNDVMVSGMKDMKEVFDDKQAAGVVPAPSP